MYIHVYMYIVVIKLDLKSIQHKSECLNKLKDFD